MARTSTHYVAVLAQQAGKLGLDVDALLTDAGIPQEFASDRSQWLANENLARLMKRLWRETGDETVGLGSQAMPMGTWGVACDFMLSAENLGELYRRGQRICKFLPPTSMGLEISTSGDSALIRIECYQGERDPEHFLVEFLGVVWHRFPCWAVDVYIPVQQAYFCYPEPEHSWIYEELLQCPVTFDQDFNGFSFSQRFLASPVRRSRAELDAWLRNSPADLLYLPGRDSSVGAHIRQQLSEELLDRMQFPSFDSICESLHMSPQVVRRRLSEEGTSYQKIKDAVRSNLVMELLVKPELPIADIAQRAGFTEPAALSRAFRKWTGMTPAQYREKKVK